MAKKKDLDDETTELGSKERGDLTKATSGPSGRSPKSNSGPLPQPKGGFTLRNSSGSGTKGVGAPTKRQPNQSKTPMKMRVPPGSQNEDAGAIRKSADFKKLMGSLNKKKPQ